jgi:ABC-type multidrug transport system ATPase subunit
LLILDEPTSNLDLLSKNNICSVITRLVKNNPNKLSVLVSTQHIEEANQLSHRILIIDDYGKNVACDTPANIKNKRGHAMRIVSHKPPQNSMEESDE